MSSSRPASDSLDRPAPSPLAGLASRARRTGLIVARVAIGLYAASALLYLLAPPLQPWHHYALADLLTILLVAGLAWRLGRVADRAVHTAVLALVLPPIGHATAFVALSGDAAQTVVLVITMLGAAYILLRVWTSVVAMTTAVVTWAVVARELASPDYVHWLINLVFTGGLGVAITWSHSRLALSQAREARLALEARDRSAGQAAALERQAEQLRVARDTAVEALRLRGELLANVSHELRTPLNGITGMAALLQGTPLTGEQRECADAISGAAAALGATVGEILDLADLESRSLGLTRAAFDPRQTVGEVLAAATEEAERKRLALDSRVDSAVPDELWGDEARFRQVLLGLVDNAVKFTDSGRVALRVGLAEARSGAPDLLCEVTDTGIGVPDGDLHRVFDAFYRADGTATRRQGGVGVGLAVCRHLVELMGGRITVARAPGGGSRFSFTVPTADRGGAAAETPAALVLHASELAGQVLGKLLGKVGFDAHCSTDAPAAVEALASGAYELAVLDAHLAGLRITLCEETEAEGGAVKSSDDREAA